MITRKFYTRTMGNAFRSGLALMRVPLILTVHLKLKVIVDNTKHKEVILLVYTQNKRVMISAIKH